MKKIAFVTFAVIAGLFIGVLAAEAQCPNIACDPVFCVSNHQYGFWLVYLNGRDDNLQPHGARCATGCFVWNCAGGFAELSSSKKPVPCKTTPEDVGVYARVNISNGDVLTISNVKRKDVGRYDETISAYLAHSTFEQMQASVAKDASFRTNKLRLYGMKEYEAALVVVRKTGKFPV